MVDETITSLDSDIYRSWGENRTRVDLPAFGPEYESWKKRVPPDAQKIVLDYMTARRMSGIKKDLCGREGFIDKHRPKSEYQRVRREVIAKAEKVADEFNSFVQEKHPELESGLVAIGVDGSSLYRPRDEGDIDVWIMFRETTMELRGLLVDEFLTDERYKEHRRSGIETRLVQLYPLEENLRLGTIHFLSLPHRIIRRFNLTEDEYQRAINISIGNTRVSKKEIYERARLSVRPGLY